MTYRAGYNHQVTERTVEPQGMFFSRGIWYVLSWCKLRRDYRTFHLGRIVHLSLTENDFEEAHRLKDISGDGRRCAVTPRNPDVLVEMVKDIFFGCFQYCTYLNQLKKHVQ